MIWAPRPVLGFLLVFVAAVSVRGETPAGTLAPGRVASPAWVGSVSVHLFTFGVMGLIIPPMLVRISKGHTGRKVVFDAGDKLLIWIMLAALVVRVVLPQVAPAAYPTWVHLAAGGWFLCFAILGARLLPRLLRPRVDGKAH